MALPDFEAYCQLIASLPDRYLSVQKSTLTAYTIGPFVAEVEGVINFEKGFVLEVWELIDLSTHAMTSYSYEVDKDGERMWWYDSQSHPNDPTLASTDPHHKHVHPNIKRNRIPAPGISFEHPNLPFLVEEVEQELLK